MLSINGLNNLPENVIIGGGSDQVEAEQSQDNSIFDNIVDGGDDGMYVEIPDDFFRDGTMYL